MATGQLQGRYKAGNRAEEPVKVNDLEDSPAREGLFSMWYGYAIEAIYTVLGTVLAATVLGILIYH
jgi:hypothetical protein